MSPLGIALKEWAVVVDALTQGELILLLRKGGIHDYKGRFRAKHGQAWLLPTYAHQLASALKPPYCDGQRPALKGHRISPTPPLETIYLKSWASITHVFPIHQSASIHALAPYHIWSDEFIQQRLSWKPHRPLMVLLLRVYRLSEPVELAMQPSYSGCRSWITLEHPIPLVPSSPALDDTAYQHQVNAITAVLQETSSDDSGADSPAIHSGHD
ncbi:hypothetical protein XM38_006130 [Halomicronema hongdechloris C2206]|uniref:DUF1802 family protein n=1 Tax=Halomicronema hongdechloris C2206 TaxID=1641165 RepID=A0A1Z3HHB6_9CYAN|nr:DUF1802 family protein [Halomicronema hongdechloris]ASC69684.1 hypothetical protein XM38_006130 [Halomicronema hongdechloris C2206]